jgi:hypothetical protein
MEIKNTYRVAGSDDVTVEGIGSTLHVTGARLVELPDGLLYLRVEPRVGDGLEYTEADAALFGHPEVAVSTLRLRLGSGLTYDESGKVRVGGGLLDITPVGGVLTPNYTSVTHNRAVVSGSVTIEAPVGLHPTGDIGATFALMLVRSGASPITLSWAPEYRWSEGKAHELSDQAGAMDIVTFMYDGQYIYGSGLKDFLQVPRL